MRPTPDAPTDKGSANTRPTDTDRAPLRPEPGPEPLRSSAPEPHAPRETAPFVASLTCLPTPRSCGTTPHAGTVIDLPQIQHLALHHPPATHAHVLHHAPVPLGLARFVDERGGDRPMRLVEHRFVQRCKKALEEVLPAHRARGPATPSRPDASVRQTPMRKRPTNRSSSRAIDGAVIAPGSARRCRASAFTARRPCVSCGPPIGVVTLPLHRAHCSGSRRIHVHTLTRCAAA